MLIEVQRRATENTGWTAAKMADGGIGHGIADLVRQHVAFRRDERHRVARVVADELQFVERETDLLPAPGVLLELPPPLFRGARHVKRPLEKLEDGMLVPCPIRARR